MKDVVEGFRKVIQDLLVPELKAVQVEIKHLNEKISALEKRIDLLHEEMNKRFEAVDKRFEAVDRRFEAIDKRFEAIHQEIMDLKVGQREILAKLDVDKRITKLEVLVEQLMKKVA